MSAESQLARLLEHPAIWRGRSAAGTEVKGGGPAKGGPAIGGPAIPTGFGLLDECLPGLGWPRTGLIELLLPRFGVGELSLLLPALAALTRQPSARWCVWVTPPLEPFAPALVAHGMILERVLVVRAPPGKKSPATLARGPEMGHLHAQPNRGRAKGVALAPLTMWAFEQSLGSGACDVAMAWARRSRSREIRRLQLAAERGRALGVLFRPQGAAREASPAILRMALEPLPQGVQITLLKSRGGMRGSVKIAWQAPSWS